MKRILVVGAGGQIGTELVPYLQHIYGEDYIILQNLSNMAQKVGDVLEQAIFYGHNQKM